MKVIYETGAFDSAFWESIAHLGQLEIQRVSQIHPVMKDLARIRGDNFRLEGAIGGPSLFAFFGLHGKLAHRHQVERALRAALLPSPPVST